MYGHSTGRQVAYSLFQKYLSRNKNYNIITYQHYRKGITLERLSSRAPRLRENLTNYTTYFVGFMKTSSALESSYSELNCFL